MKRSNQRWLKVVVQGSTSCLIKEYELSRMGFCSELPVHSKTHRHWSPVESTSKSSSRNGEGRVTLGHRLVLHRCLWSRQTRQPFLVKVTVTFRFLSDGLITSQLLIAENKCFGSIQFSYIPTVVDRNTTKFPRGTNRAGVFMGSRSWLTMEPFGKLLPHLCRVCFPKQPHQWAHPDWPKSAIIWCHPIHSCLMTGNGHKMTKECKNNNNRGLAVQKEMKNLEWTILDIIDNIYMELGK